MNYDLAVMGGTLVIPGQGLVRGSVAVRGQKIAAILGPGEPIQANRYIDAEGLVVFPGIIESHSHLGIGQGFKDLSTETAAAARGGVTTILFFLRHPEPYDELFMTTVAEGERRSVIDFSFHIALLTAAHVKEIGRYVRSWGITSFKYYMTYRGEDAAARDFDGQMKTCPSTTDGFLLSCLERVVEEEGSLLMVHAENIEVIQEFRRRLQLTGRQDMTAWQESRPAFAEIEAVRRLLTLAEATRTPLVVVHVTTHQALAEIAQARGRGLPIYAEVCHPYLMLHDNGQLTRLHKVRPPLRPAQEVEVLWRRLADGAVDVVASDHVPRPLASKEGDLWKSATGLPGTPTLLPIMLSEAYHRRGVPLWRIAELLCLRPAMLYGLYPRKGVIQVGSDADLTLVDLSARRIVRAEELGSVAGYSPYEGWTLQGWPTHTIVRGKVVMEGGRITEPEGWGRFISRRAALLPS